MNLAGDSTIDLLRQAAGTMFYEAVNPEEAVYNDGWNSVSTAKCILVSNKNVSFRFKVTLKYCLSSEERHWISLYKQMGHH